MGANECGNLGGRNYHIYSRDSPPKTVFLSTEEEAEEILSLVGANTAATARLRDRRRAEAGGIILQKRQEREVDRLLFL
jgi:hypothetical protein